LWNGGISFGGVVAFIFADLLIPPILNIYRKYYGARMTAFMFWTFYVAMVVAALVVEGLFGLLGCHATDTNVSITFDYTAALNIVFGVLGLALTVAFFRSGGPEMMRMMSHGQHEHSHAGPH
jgi:uncharacterized protein